MWNLLSFHEVRCGAKLSGLVHQLFMLLYLKRLVDHARQKETLELSVK